MLVLAKRLRAGLVPRAAVASQINTVRIVLGELLHEGRAKTHLRPMGVQDSAKAFYS